ncbi:hypothetical protein Y1Q_0011399 [Alligator mississippiensis]|uniref:Uncharacterized protein n=2 Tax=Alligator mississippiensis TaxID=8496 RepID=A0A151P4U8_ALLMI|nr:hypothetical protein Y1Q_0011399 [Alligator mississippiensis]
MQDIIEESVDKEVNSGMFERAAKTMKDEFQKLKEGITRTLQMDFSNMLKLTFFHKEELVKRLPDLQNEYKEIMYIHSAIQVPGNA